MVVLLWPGDAESNYCHLDECGFRQGDALAAKIVADPEAEFVQPANEFTALRQGRCAPPGSIGDHAIHQLGACRLQAAYFHDQSRGPGAAAGIQHMCGEMAQLGLFSGRRNIYCGH